MKKEKFYRMSSVCLSEDVVYRYKKIKSLYPQVSMSKLLSQKIKEYVLPSDEINHDEKVNQLLAASEVKSNE